MCLLKIYCVPLWSSISSSYKSSDETYKNDTADDAAGETLVQKAASENEQALKNVLDKMMDQEKEASEQSDAVRKEFEAQCKRELLQGKATKASNTNSFNTVSTPVNVANDSLMPDLEDTAEVQNTSIFGSAFDDEDLDTYNSPFADQVMGAKADFKNMEPSTVEATKIAQALNDESWVEAMQEELLLFKIKKVWTLVDLPYGKKAISTKWVYKNKKDEMIEAISQPPGFMDLEFPEKVYKVEKALYGLHQAPRAWFQMSSMGELTFFLGLQVKQKEDGIFISQDKFCYGENLEEIRSGEGRMEHQFELMANVPITPHDSPLLGGYTPGSYEGRLQLQELMTIMRLERQRKSSNSQPRRRKYRQFESLDDDLDEEDASKQGRGSDEIKPILCNFTPCLWMLEAEEESTMAFELIKFIKSMLEE
ncbi:putative ribonuclease H-like domain-containing protein [Tanacetum coccineum]|uniref:Ribonuclease H-like domain-containing protein n=1 Tax=Tanacetum coccineum TaxID=301880 RepID=A0ABQ5E4P4_9ASTR